MKKFFIAGLILSAVFLNATVSLQAASYEETVAQWTSYKDVANWLKKYFSYDYAKYKTFGMLWDPLPPKVTFERRSGICEDGAVFAKNALNRINPAYKAKLVFIKNRDGGPNHVVTAFTLDGKLYIMDFSAGSGLRAMMGLHGPYDSLQDYQNFLASLTLRSFKVESVWYEKSQNKEASIPFPDKKGPEDLKE